VVIGGGAIEVVRALQQAKLPGAVVSTPTDATKYSPRIKSVFCWDWTQPMECHDAALADRLVSWARSLPERPVLFYSSDQALLFTSRYRDRLAEGFRFAIPRAELVEAMADQGAVRRVGRAAVAARARHRDNQSGDPGWSRERAAGSVPAGLPADHQAGAAGPGLAPHR
jgi:glycosyltransferase involved in cell wall biosynthesis